MSTKQIVRATWVAMALCAAPARVDDPTPSAPQKPTDLKQLERRTFQAKYLLLSDNRVLQAHVLQDNAGYLIQTSSIKSRLAANMVQTTGDSLKDLYTFKKGQFPANDLSERYKLARWCMQVQLKDEAVAELTEYCRLAPSNKDASKLLARLTGAEEAPVGVMPAGNGMEGADAMAKDVADAFSQPILENFAGRIQLVLKNKCLPCHGANYQGDFKLTFREIGGVGMTSRNFTAVEKQIDLKTPLSSKLLQMAYTPHGGRKTQPLGPRDPKFKELREWVVSAAKSWNEDIGGAVAVAGDDKSDVGALADVQSHRPGVKPATKSRPSAMVANSKPKMTKLPVGDRPGFTPAADDAPPSPPKTMPKKPAAGSKPTRDPFDPAEFNEANNTGDAVPPEAAKEKPAAPPADKPKSPPPASGDVWGKSDSLPDAWKTAPKK